MKNCFSSEISLDKFSYYLPVVNKNVKDFNLDNPDWNIHKVIEKTGINKIYFAEEDETSVDLAIKAINSFFKKFQVDPNSIEGLLFVTQSPDYALPTSACIIQEKTGLPETILGFDINLGCSGFVNSLAVAASLIKSSTLNNCLIVCAETYSKYINKNDRTTKTLFSDAAAVCLLEKNLKSDFLFSNFYFGLDGKGASNLIVKGSGARKQIIGDDNSLFMDGGKVFMFTMSEIPKFINMLLIKNNKTVPDIDLFVFHQASKLVLDTLSKKLDLPSDKVFRNLGSVGNTVSCSIPIAICDAIEQKKIYKGATIMLVGFGVGYSWGGTIIKWGD